MFKPLKHPNVRILAGEPELIGQTGVIFGREGKLHQVRLNALVETAAKGLVTTELFETAALRIIRPPVVKAAKAAAPAVDPTPSGVALDASKANAASDAPVVLERPQTQLADAENALRLPGDALTTAEHEQVYPGGEPIVPDHVVEPVSEAAKDAAIKGKGKNAKAAKIADAPKAKKAGKVGRGAVILKR